MSPSRTESLGVDGNLSVRIQRTVREEASMRAQAFGRQGSAQPDARAEDGAVDPGAPGGRFLARLCCSGTCAAVLSSLSSV